MKERLINAGIAVVVFSLTMFIMSSCSSSGIKTESKQSRSKNYELYTEMLSKYPLGSNYNDIIAYLEEIGVYYTENTEEGKLPKIQLYGGQLFFTSDSKLNSVTSTHWTTTDGWGAGSTIDDITAVCGEGDKLEKFEQPTYVFTKDNVRYTVTFDEHFIVEHWTLS